MPTLAPVVREGRFGWSSVTITTVLAGDMRAGAACVAAPPLQAATAGNLPVGVQLISRWYDEATVLRLGAGLETVSPVRNRHPDLA